VSQQHASLSITVNETQSKNASVKLAVVGCGLITDENHLPAVLATPGLEVGALVDADVERARLVARKYGSRATVTTRLDDVIDQVDAVVVATPNHTHFALAKLALSHRRPVLLEKPMTNTAQEADELCALSRETSTPLSIGFVTRHFPVVALTKRLLDEGKLGSVRRFHFEYGTRGGWAPLSGYNLSRQQSGGGVLVVSGTHFLDRMLHWFGAPQSFHYADDSFGGVEANCKASFTFAGGIEGTVFFSKTMPLKNALVIETDRYTVRSPWGEMQQLHARAHDLPDVSMTMKADGTPATVNPFQRQMAEFLEVVRDGRRPMVTAEEGAASVRLCESMYSNRQQLDEPWAWYRSRKHGVA
jgi:predicted dehydrogenase